MDLRKPKKKICEKLGIGEPLEAFKRGPFPAAEDVLRHFYFHLWELARPDAESACRSTAKSLELHWAPAYLPLMASKNIVKKVHRLHDQLRAVLTALRLKRKNAAAKQEQFLKEMKTRFDISAEKAFEIIAADKTRTVEEKEEDRLFLIRIRDNLPHSLGPLDVKRVARLERIAAREAEAAARAEKEKERKEVSK